MDKRPYVYTREQREWRNKLKAERDEELKNMQNSGIVEDALNELDPLRAHDKKLAENQTIGEPDEMNLAGYDSDDDSKSVASYATDDPTPAEERAGRNVDKILAKQKSAIKKELDELKKTETFEKAMQSLSDADPNRANIHGQAFKSKNRGKLQR